LEAQVELKPPHIIALGGGVALAAVAFVALIVGIDEFAPEDEVVEIVQATQARPANHAQADQPKPTEVAADAFRDVGDGLKVADIVVGTGGEPVSGAILSVHYSGWLQTDGTMFDSSLKRKQPIKFAFETGGVISGWHKGMAGMKVGGKRQLLIPPDLAYGESGRPPVIPPSSTLIFDVELVDIGEVRVPPTQPTEPPAVALDKGVKYVDLVVGNGTTVGTRSVIEGELTVWKPDGEVFFSSLSALESVRFMEGGEGRDKPPLEGIGIGIMGMQAGGTRYMELPPDVAFGEKGFRDQMPPNATVFAQLTAKTVSGPRVAPESMPSFDRSAMTTTESGLMYLDIVIGTGDTPQAGQMVQAEYTGWLENGTQFDSSYKRMGSFDFPLGRGAVIKAWDEVVSTMKVGGKRIIVAPADLAYGDKERPQIPANSTLIFEIELKGVRSRE
jgi:peptidylprolyl isomerase